jgi:signal transduction histidine kinase/DNA-binding response OmpR family regulator
MANQREKILVVENDPIIADLISRQALSGLAFNVKVVEEASAAIQQAMSFQPDVVIVNLDLPGLSGKDLIAALSFQNVKIPVIVISSSGQEKDVIQAFRLGASDFINMPIRETEVVSVVERALKTVRASKEREQLANRLQHANQELKHRVEQLTSLFAIGKAVTSATNQKKLFQKIVEEAVNITQADFGWFLNRDDTSGEFILRAQINLPKSLLEYLNKPWDDGISTFVARSGETFSIHGLPMERFMLYSLGKSALVVPVKAHNQMIGLLVVMRKLDHAFNPGDQAMLEGVSDYAAISMVNARLFQALDERAASLQATVEQTQHDGRVKDQVIYMVNQELRTSLLAATEYLNQLVEGDQSTLSRKQIMALGLARKSLNEIVQINQTMTFLQDASATREDARLEISELVKEAVERSSPSAEISQVSLNYKLPDNQVFVSGDRNQILAVLDALISNSIKLSQEGGNVVATLHPSKDGQVQVSIANEGSGVKKGTLEKILTPFTQNGDLSTDQFEGLGVGLGLVREVIESHGGQVWVDSKVNKGSTFHFSLPGNN